MTLYPRVILIFSICIAIPASGTNLPEPAARFHFNKKGLSGEPDSWIVKEIGVSKTYDRFGNPESAIMLYGTRTSYLNLGTTEKLKPREGSVSIWFSVENFVHSGHGYNANPIILTKSHAGDDFFEGYSLTLHPTTRKIHASAGYAINSPSTTDPTAISGNQISTPAKQKIDFSKWYHAVITYSDTAFDFYLNGELQIHLKKYFASRFLHGDSVMVGNSANKKNSRYFQGAVDDIEIFDKVLTAAQVKMLYNAPDPNRFNAILNAILKIAAGLLVLALMAWIIIQYYRRKLSNLRRLYEMESRVQKAQMNPHFIFNAMNAVQQLIPDGENEKAYRYLGTFSRLLRKILESNKEDYVSLETEIDMLLHYMEIESLRFPQGFRYKISTDANITGDHIKIPQMLIQPLVENAIWHGLLPGNSQGTLSIHFASENKRKLMCVVEDDGVGRSLKNEAGTNGTFSRDLSSHATNFITERLKLMSREWNEKFTLEYVDKKDENGNPAGTRAIIQIPILN